MSDVLSLGENVSCTLESESVSCFRPAVHESIAAEHLSSELRAQLAKPLNFPPLASATVPGDNAVIALEYGTPHCEELVRGALAALQDAGIEQDRVTLLLSHGFSKDKNTLLLQIWAQDYEKGARYIGSVFSFLSAWKSKKGIIFKSWIWMKVLAILLIIGFDMLAVFLKEFHPLYGLISISAIGGILFLVYFVEIR